MSASSDQRADGPGGRIAAWREAHRLKIQAGALAGMIGASLALHGALAAGRDGLAAALFAGVAAGMLVTIWVS
jgi:hypothetical protein